MATRRPPSSPAGAVSAQEFDSLYESAMIAAAEAYAVDLDPRELGATAG